MLGSHMQNHRQYFSPNWKRMFSRIDKEEKVNYRKSLAIVIDYLLFFFFFFCWIYGTTWGWRGSRNVLQKQSPWAWRVSENSIMGYECSASVGLINAHLKIFSMKKRDKMPLCLLILHLSLISWSKFSVYRSFCDQWNFASRNTASWRPLEKLEPFFWPSFLARSLLLLFP